MNFVEKTLLGIVLSLFSYFAVYPYFQPHIETMQDKLESWREARYEKELANLDREIKQMEEEEELIKAREATQSLQDRVDAKKRTLKTPKKSLLSKALEELKKE